MRLRIAESVVASQPGARTSAPTRRAAWAHVRLALPLGVLIGVITFGGAADRAPAKEPPPAAKPDTIPSEYKELRERGEALMADGSFEKARGVYEQARRLKLPPAEERWVRFRLADATLRSQASTQHADDTKLQKARSELERLIAEVPRPEDRDLVWAEAQESLGDQQWSGGRRGNWGGAWNYYAQALDWWAASSDLELARERYLRIVRKAADQRGDHFSHTYGSWGQIPVEVIENAIRISVKPDDATLGHFLLAMTLRNHGDWRQQLRVEKEFEAALEAGSAARWFDDALFYFAEWLSERGRPMSLGQGQWRNEPDYVKAVQLYRRLTTEFAKGETRFFDQAKERIKQITDPQLGVSVANTFLPDSLVQYNLSWRNVKQISLKLYRVTLADFADLSDGDPFAPTAGLEAYRSWGRDTGDKGDFKPGNDSLTLDEKLPLGAYILEGAANGLSARDLVLVTDASLVLRSSGKRALLYFCDALTGAPIADGRVVLWEYYQDNNRWRSEKHEGQTDAQGLATFDLKVPQNWRYLFASAVHGERQAYTQSSTNRYWTLDPHWKLYAFTDRPAYRPGDTARWKVLARTYQDGKYSTPAGRTLKMRIADAKGANVVEKDVTLNEFGSTWGELALTDQMPLGEFRVYFLDGDQQVGGATFLRLEEYKLPEYRVRIETPKDERGQPKAFRVGDTVEATIQAEFYFGGPVGSADVQVIVYQQPYYAWWRPPRTCGWLYEDDRYDRYWGGWDGQQIKSETLKTDAQGKAVVKFETPFGAQQDFQYTIEARVTDSSRREITAKSAVRVTRQRFFAYLNADHNIYAPRDQVKVAVKTLDANEKPVSVSGEIRLTRERWVEVWIDPNGKECAGDALRAAQAAAGGIFPPPPKPGEAPWQLKFRGYERDELGKQTLKTNAEGEAEYAFSPERDGYYLVSWGAEDEGYGWVRGDANVYVATNATEQLGYRPGGVDLIVDKDTFHTGQTAAVMLTVPGNDRYVLFSIDAEDIYSYQLVHVTGSAKLLQVPITAQHVPNIYLNAAMVADRNVFYDQERVVVPPVEQFITVEIAADSQTYEPRGEGVFTIRTRDHAGQPIAAEIGVSVRDEAVSYIQEDYAGDPRQFFYGRTRGLNISLDSTFGRKAYARLVKDGDQVIDDRARAQNERQRWLRAAGQAGDAELEMLGRENAPRGGPMRDLDAGGFGGGAAYAWSFDASKSGRFDSRERLSESGVTQLGAALQPVSAARGELAEKKLPMAGQAGGGGAKGGEWLDESAVTVRADFRATAFWEPAITTDADGTASIKVKFPDSLTGWEAIARAFDRGGRVGSGKTSVRTRQPLICRLQAPRFFVVGDTAVVSAVLNNNTEAPLPVLPSLTVEGVEIEGYLNGGSWSKDAPGPVTVPPSGETRVDWLVRVTAPGSAKLKAVARGEKYADAMERMYPVFEHGLDKLLARTGKVRGEDVTISIELPAERRPGSTSLVVQVTPSVAVTMLDALPYLVNYPYGCVEQTMSRFLPAAITAKTLKDLGLPAETVANRLFGGVEQTPENLKRLGPKNLEKLDEVVKQCLERLYDAQRRDGGWGWWKEPVDQESDHFMTAYVLWGLLLAREAGTDLRDDVLTKAADFLAREMVERESEPDMQAWILHALSVYRSQFKGPATPFEQKALANLYERRAQLNAYTRALLALAAHAYGRDAQAKTLIENLENGIKVDETPDTSVVMRGAQESHPAVIPTAHWGEDGVYYRWSDGGVEATAFALRALLAIDPHNPRVEQVTNWLLKNRRGAQWNSTRDTAIVVLAMNEYLRTSGELKPEIEFEVLVNGKSAASKKIAPEDGLNAPGRFAIDPALLRDGRNDVRIVRQGGAGPIYFAVEARFFSREEPITPAGTEIFVRRQYYRLVEKPTLLKGIVNERIPLNDGDTIRSGERVECVVLVESKNNYEYLIFEDLKPAGFEAVQVRSGESAYIRELKTGAVVRQLGERPTAERGAEEHMRRGDADYTGRSRWVHQELRDRLTALFVDKLPEGVWEFRYELRAEVPGDFHALPLTGYAMYVPEIRANDAEIRVKVVDR